MTDPVGFTAYAIDTALFIAGWCVLALIIGLLYVRLCWLADKRAREEQEMREFLTAVGRIRREEHLAEMIANADAMVAEVNDARAIGRILRDVRNAPVLAEADIDRMVG